MNQDKSTIYLLSKMLSRGGFFLFFVYFLEVTGNAPPGFAEMALTVMGITLMLVVTVVVLLLLVWRVRGVL